MLRGTGVRITASVKTVLVFASRAGMESTARWKAVQTVAVAMASAKPTLRGCGSANVIRAGLEPSVR